MSGYRLVRTSDKTNQQSVRGDGATVAVATQTKSMHPHANWARHHFQQRTNFQDHAMLALHVHAMHACMKHGHAAKQCRCHHPLHNAPTWKC